MAETQLEKMIMSKIGDTNSREPLRAALEFNVKVTI